MSTIYEVARLASVSTATVSRVLNRSGYSSAEVRRRVTEAAQQLNFVPSSAARSLVNKRTFTLALVIPDIVNPFFPALARGAEDAASATRHNLILCNTDGQRRREQEYVAMLREKRVDGIIQAGSSLTPKQLAVLKQSNIPIAAVDRRLKLYQVDTVYCDNLTGGELAVRHLYSLGHRRIAVIAGPAQISTSMARLEGARMAMVAAGLETPAAWVEHGDFQMEGGYEAARRLLKRFPAKKGLFPTAIFAANDQMAAGVIWALREAGLAVPDDVSVVGYDDIPWAKVLSPPLTTVSQPAYELGRTAVDLLIGRITEPERPVKTVVLEPTLIIRESTASVSQ